MSESYLINTYLFQIDSYLFKKSISNTVYNIVCCYNIVIYNIVLCKYNIIIYNI